MSNDSIKNGSIININMPPSVDNAVKNLTDKPTLTLGEIISDCIFLVFGGIQQKANFKRIEYVMALEKFKNELEEKLNNVPENKRIEANTHTICTALDNMKYCVEEETLRNLFSSLIANSINSDKEKLVHPSFGEIIKQMSSLDAAIFRNMNMQVYLPIIHVNIRMDSRGSEKVMTKNLIWYDGEGIDKVAVSLDNLSRLKLIDISFETYYTDEKIYDDLMNMNHILQEINRIEKIVQETERVKIIKGIVKINDFGRSFYDACN